MKTMHSMSVRLIHLTMQFFYVPVAQCSNPEVILHFACLQTLSLSVRLCQTCEKASKTQ